MAWSPIVTVAFVDVIPILEARRLPYHKSCKSVVLTLIERVRAPLGSRGDG